MQLNNNLFIYLFLKYCFSVASGEDLVPEPENEVEEL